MTKQSSLLTACIERAEEKVNQWKKVVKQIEEHHQERVLQIFREEEVASFHFQSSTGYGYDDTGRDTLDRIYAKVFGTESALVRQQFVSGTHAITTALFGVMRPGDHLLYVGLPYDTLQTVIGLTGNEKGTLKEYGMTCDIAPLNQDGYPEAEEILSRVKKETKVIAFQRSKGYAKRPSLDIARMETLIQEIKASYPDMIIFVDNCYGEFVEEKEPGHIGADLLAGSLIKNPGGGIVRTGGYIAGKEQYIEEVAARFAAPGIGLETGATIHMLQEMYQGLFLAPHVVQEALLGAYFTASLAEEVGLTAFPSSNEKRTDLIQSIHFEDEKRMITFAEAIQHASPVDSYVTPVASDMPGYDSKVIMAAGAFIQGSSIELSADGPLRPPYALYIQGGLTYTHVKIAVTHAMQRLIDEQLLSLE